MQKFNFNNPGGLLNINPNDTGSLGINISPINEQKKLEDEQRKKEEQRLKLQNLADTFNMIGANQSGDTQRMAFHSNRLAQRKAEQEARQLKAQKELQRRDIYNNAPQNIQMMMDYANANVSPAIINSLANASKDNRTEEERARDRLMQLNNNPKKSAQENYESDLLKTKLYGKKEIIPFFDSDGNPTTEVFTNWDLMDNPTLEDNLSKQGFVTVGSNPSSGFKAPINASQEISDKWESFTNEINLINDLGKLIVEGEDSITFAGKVADVLNTGIYQFKSAGRLLQFKENDPQGYSKQINDIQNEHGKVLDKISADRGVGASLVMQLAYGLAKNVDPNARLTDRDIEAAIEMLGGSGANAKKRLATFNKLVENRTREYNIFLDKKKLVHGKNKKVLNTIDNFKTLPTFGYYNAPKSQVGKYQIEVVN